MRETKQSAIIGLEAGIVGTEILLPNVTGAIKRLPSEILAQIFFIIAELDPPCRFTVAHHGKIFHLGWILVTHVCHSWRRAALEHRGLWSRLDFVTPRAFLDEMIIRSGDAPVDISTSQLHPVLDLEMESLYALHCFLKSQAARRVRSLDIMEYFGKCAILSKFLDNFSEPGPLLEAISMHSAKWSWKFPPCNLFTLKQPRLRQLHLRGIALSSWANPNLPNLVDLSLHFVTSSNASAKVPTVIEVLDILRSAPRLKRIELNSGYRGNEVAWARAPTPLDILEPVPLHALEKMHLVCKKKSECLAFSSLLKFPSSARVDIKSNGKGSLRTQLQLLSPRQHEFGPLRWLRFDSPLSEYTLEFRKQDQPHVLPSTPSVFRVTEVFDEPAETFDLTAVVRILASAVSFQGLRYVEIYGFNWTNFPFVWKTFFASAEQVEEVVASGRANLADALLSELAEFTPEGRPVLFPALKILGTLGVEFDFPLSTPGISTLRGQAFIRMVEERRDHGHALQMYKPHYWPAFDWVLKIRELGLPVETRTEDEDAVLNADDFE